MELWLWMTLISGVFLGFYDIFRKKALEKVPLFNVLALYSLFCFLAVAFDYKKAFSIEMHSLGLVFAKSVVIFGSWILSFMAIRNMPISVMVPFSTLSPVFSILFGLFLLNESMGYLQAAGISIIVFAYYLIGRAGKTEVADLLKNKYFYITAGGALLSSVSAILDKIALRSVDPAQMQFWFCFFLTILYFSVFLARGTHDGERKKLRFSYFILLMSFFIVIADRLYFHALRIPLSQISIVSPVRRSSTLLVSCMIGGAAFKEKNLKAKFTAVCLIITGLILLFLEN